MATLYTQQTKNVQKTWALMTGFLVFIIALGWSVSWYYGNSTILYFFVGFSLLMNFFSYWFSDKVVLKMSGAKQVSRDTNRELWNILENLCIASGLPMPKLYIINDMAPNAFATGRDEKHAAVAVTSGLLNMLDRSELEGVIAHELSHIKNRDILVMTIVVVLVGFVTLLSDFMLRWGLIGGGNNKSDGRLKLIMILAGVVLAILAPIVAMIIQLAISRKREFLADASGALMTRYPQGLAGALKKISRYSGELKRANHATAHLYIANPFKGKKHTSGFMARLFMTHPPVGERINALMGVT